MLTPHILEAQETTDSIAKEHELGDIIVKASTGTRSRSRVESVDIIGKSQLIRAACCNLGELQQTLLWT